MSSSSSSTLVSRDNHQHDQEVEVDATLVFRKSTKLRSIDGNISLFHVNVYESESPYVMIFLLHFSGTKNENKVRMDVVKQDLAKELHYWLFEGKKIHKPAVCLSKRVEHLIQAFVNLNKTPKQEDLIMWILSRSELSIGNESTMKFGGFESVEVAAVASPIHRVTRDNFATLGDQSIRNEQKQLKCDFSSSNSKLVEVDKSSAADVATFALMSKLLGSRAAAVNHINQAKLVSLATSIGARQRQDLQPYVEIERRKNIRNAQLSAYKLLRSDGKKYPEQKKAMPPARNRSGTTNVSKRPASAPVKRVDIARTVVENDQLLQGQPNEDELRQRREAAGAAATAAPQRHRNSACSRTGSSVAELAKNKALKGGLTTAHAAWASDVLNRQARLEKRIGRDYY